MSRKLSKLRKAAHRAFDPIWRDAGRSRTKAYRWLSYKLGIAIQDCHFSKFDAVQLERAILVCNEKYRAPT